MSSQKTEGRVFHHPFTPYDIQKTFMTALYDAIETGKIGIFESPTGTGKSLSLICGAMTWLRDHQTVGSLSVTSDISTAADRNEPAWVVESHRKHFEEEKLRKYREFESRLRKARQKESRARALVRKGSGLSSAGEPKRNRTIQKDLGEREFIVDDYESESEDVIGDKKKPYNQSNLSSDAQALLKMLDPSAEVQEEVRTNLFEDEIRIFYASRTHSQLSQFVQQLDLPTFPPSELYPSSSTVRHVPLASRRQLCIHPTVSRLRDVEAINDKCTEMQQKSADKRCPFMKSERIDEDRQRIQEFHDQLLINIHDIEDMSEIGKSLSVCPYYGSRSAMGPSEIVTLPYPLLLQASNRKALGISLKNQIVIIDEAHNLLDAIVALYSRSVSLADIMRAKSGVETYLKKFDKKLNSGNRVYIRQIIQLLDVLHRFIANFKGGSGDEILQNDILLDRAADTINVFKIAKYLEKSKLARKVESYLSTLEAGREVSKDGSIEKVYNGTPLLTKIASFLETLTNPSKEGKIIFNNSNGERSLKYLLLDPGFHFRSIVDEARCVILAGGTMEPVDDLVTYLFPYVPQNDIVTLNCDHVIPKNHLTALTLSSGPSGVQLKFTFEKQGVDAMAIDLGRAISNLAFVIPGGVVVFFPSYKYLDYVVSVWKTLGEKSALSIWVQLEKRKKIFMEPRGSESADQILSLYAQEIIASKGALLLAVVGGKMSEGINFSDDLARGIIMVGLPYPNSRSADMIARKNYIAKTVSDTVKSRYLRAGLSTAESIQKAQLAAEDAAREYYENVCMRAVNQSIGRGIRHAKDYAVIIFADCRFANQAISRKLPRWIRERYDEQNAHSNGQMGTVMKKVREFFNDKEKRGLAT